MKKFLTVALFVVAACGLTAPAHADDTRPCVSKRESNGHHKDQTRAYIERAWEVQRLGGDGIMAHLLDPPTGTHIVDYPACGYSTSEAGVAVFYNHDETVRYVMRYWATTATLHGHKRVR